MYTNNKTNTLRSTIKLCQILIFYLVPDLVEIKGNIRDVVDVL